MFKTITKLPHLERPTEAASRCSKQISQISILLSFTLFTFCCFSGDRKQQASKTSALYHLVLPRTPGEQRLAISNQRLFRKATAKDSRFDGTDCYLLVSLLAEPTAVAQRHGRFCKHSKHTPPPPPFGEQSRDCELFLPTPKILR